MIEKKKMMGEFLLEQNIITLSQLEAALKKQKELSLPLGEVLVKLGYVKENTLLEILSKKFGIEFLNIAENDFQLVDRSLSNILLPQMCKQFNVLPVFHLADNGIKELTLAMADPLDDKAIKEVEKATGCHVIPIFSTSLAISGAIKKLYGLKDEIKSTEIKQNKADKERTVAVVNRILAQAIELGASDIHIEPHAKVVHIRMRVDGVLQIISTLPSSQLASIISRLKIMGSENNSLMKIEEKRVPQDGSFARAVGGHAVDFRVSTFPTIYGEKMVLRVLDKNQVYVFDYISDLKMPPRIEKQFGRYIRQASGIIIATGPTGSGKSTTLRAAINEINKTDVNIVTVEDPVEYHASDYVNQSSLMPQAGYTYPLALRSILRQDPDIILIGEIRDLETAEIAIQAALTGHLVFTTLHTDDAAGAIVRLVDLGIEQFLVSSTVVSAINQRLVRKVCAHCAEKHEPTREELLDLYIDKKTADEILNSLQKFKILKGKGCSNCRQTGFSGRIGTYENLSVTPSIKKLILMKETSDVIAKHARKTLKINMLFEETLRLVLTGKIALEELKKIPRGDYKMKPIEQIFQDSRVETAVPA